MATTTPALTSATAAAGPIPPTASPLEKEEQPQKPIRIMKKALSSKVVHIQVGEDVQDFGVHKDLICHYAPYFKAAFNSGFEESNTGILKLPETKVEVFELFNTWLYTQSLWNGEDDEESWPSFEHLIELYVFADMARVPQLMNYVIDTLVAISDLSECLPDDDVLSFGWEKTPESSPLRRLIVDWIMFETNADFFEGQIENLPMECLLGCIRAMQPIVCEFRDTKKGMKSHPGIRASNYHVANETQKSSS
ncbi:hypothetical protein VTL71DRAFT_14401 [Oculimacula yallundae]|uniref:BTB domain-containing protein n=1 Tax=Oculimacula yallundae TaxID=86028 RepID=A0ABR4CJP7_9HELO